jgi:CRISPR/Cas system-associated protein Cas10 (large subunit of type III CRISPR-Cas system)
MPRDLDRFAPPDSEPPIVAHCAWCGREIRAGDEVKRIDDGHGFVHDGWSHNCAQEYAYERTYDAEGVINAYGEVE